jgi:Delta7-sterol 5-desaturase
VDAFEGFLRRLDFGPAIALALLENVVVFLLAVGGGALVTRWFAHRPLARPPRLTRVEVLIAAGTVVVNAAVTVAGFALFRAGILRVSAATGFRVALDVVFLFLVMDAAMYALHRLAHVAALFPLGHRLHHRFDRPRALDLFVLSPLESLAFGVLWLAVITAYTPTWLGMGIYLGINVVFGTLGHVGVEPLPDAWTRWPVLRQLATTTFHAQHHHDPGSNFGFYTVVWDRCFGTLSPVYEARFGRPLDDATAPEEPVTNRPV